MFSGSAQYSMLVFLGFFYKYDSSSGRDSKRYPANSDCDEDQVRVKTHVFPLLWWFFLFFSVSVFYIFQC